MIANFCRNVDRFYSSSINNYLNIFDITVKSINGNFIKIPNLNIDISFNNIIKIEDDRKSVNKITGLSGGSSYKFKNANINFELKMLLNKIILDCKF
jgi:hypothetical protein